MGVTIESKKGKLFIDMGYDGFYKLRIKVALLAMTELGVAYAEATGFYYMSTASAKERAIEEINDLVDTGKVSYKVVDFLFQSDCSGKIHYGACKELLKVIGDYDDSIIYGYTSRTGRAMFKDFKAILQECVDLKCDLIWF